MIAFFTFAFHSLFVAHAVGTPIFYAKSIVSSVVRSNSKPDSIVSSLCPAECRSLFAALPDNSTNNNCACICPRATPIFHNSVGRCVASIEECKASALQWADSDSVPAFKLPPKNGIVNLVLPLHSNYDVNGSGIIESCQVQSTQFESGRHRWAETATLFRVRSIDGKYYIILDGREEDAWRLGGSIVQLRLLCDGLQGRVHSCVAFRVVGKSGWIEESQWREDPRYQRLFLIGVALLFLILFVGFCVILQICQNLKRRKRKIVAMMQSRVLRVQKEQQFGCEQPLGDFEIIYDNEEDWSLRDNNGNYLQGEKRAVIPQSRNAYSLDSLDSDNLQREYATPEEEEQLIRSLRRMVDVARQRLKLRKFVPVLVVIPEEEMQDDTSCNKTTDSNIHIIETKIINNSDSNEIVASELNNNSIEPLGLNRVKQLISDFENLDFGNDSQKCISSTNFPPRPVAAASHPQRFKSMIPTPIAQRSPRFARPSAECRRLGHHPSNSSPNFDSNMPSASVPPSMRANRVRRCAPTVKGLYFNDAMRTKSLPRRTNRQRATVSYG